MPPGGVSAKGEDQHRGPLPHRVSIGDTELAQTNLVTINPLLERAQAEHYAVGAFNGCDSETIQAAIEEADARRSPVIIIVGPWELPLAGPGMVAEMTRFAAAQTDVPVSLHLDHAVDMDTVKECIAAGFPSVMIDGSHFPYEENVALTKAVVDLAHPKGIAVEGELGAVGRVGDATPEGGAGDSLTSPSQAAEFVERTGVDALAVAFGNAHGLYTQLPALDFDRLQAIRNTVSVPLVLHGGSGTSVEQLKRAISIGISKANVASEIGRAYLDAVQYETMEKNGRKWYAHGLLDAKMAAREVVGRWMVALGCAGKAP